MDVIAPHQCLLLPQALNPSSSLHRKHFLFFLLTFHEHHTSLLFCGVFFPFNVKNSQSLEAVLSSTCAIWDHVSLIPHRLNCRHVPYYRIDQHAFLYLGKKSFLLETISSAPASKGSSELQAQQQFAICTHSLGKLVLL